MMPLGLYSDRLSVFGDRTNSGQSDRMPRITHKHPIQLRIKFQELFARIKTSGFRDEGGAKIRVLKNPLY